MKLDGYREHLRDQGTPEDETERRMAIARDFVAFLAAGDDLEIPATARRDPVERWARKLIGEGRNTEGSFSAASDFAGWLGDRSLYVAILELTDCYNALEVLADTIAARHGPEMREAIFRDPLPPLGSDEAERSAYTGVIAARMAERLSSPEVRSAWFQVQHGIPASAWQKSYEADRARFEQCERDVDEFLALQRRDRDELLTRLRDEGRLWYTVEITDEVLAFATGDPEIEAGRREGGDVYITKIPYNAVRYLQTIDPKMRRYYACHCPLAREAILQDRPISSEICNCSLGHASHYLAGLGMALEGEVLESAIRGDERCRFVFHLAPAEDAKGIGPAPAEL